MTYIAAENRYESIPYRRVGRSGLVLPALSLGLWHNFGDSTPIDTQRALLRTAFDLGINHFDLANNYGPPYGSAEEQFGRIVAANLVPYRDELVVSSKAGYDMRPGPYGDGGSRKYLLNSLEASLERTGLDYVDVFYSHRPDPETPIEETMGALATAVHQGKALYAGISNYGPEQTQAAIDALADEGVPLLIHQPRYNMFDRKPEQGLFETLLDNGVGSIVFSPLAGGLLTNRYLSGKAPAGSRAAEGRWFTEDALSETYLERVRGLNDIAEARGQSLAQLALTWVLRQPAVTSALIGASSVAQLDDSLDALHGAELTDDEVAAIEPFAVDGTGR